MKIKDDLNLNGYILQNFCIDNYDSLDSINDKNAGRTVFLTGNDTNAGYRHVNVYDGTKFRALAYLDDVTNNEEFIQLKNRVDAFLGGEVDSDAVLENLKEIQAFLDNYSGATSLSKILDTKLDKKGGTITSPIEEALHIYRANDYVGIKFSNGEVGNGWVGFNGYGAYIYTNGHYLHVTLDGKPCYDNKTLLHAGNVGDYALKTDGSNKMGASAYINWATAEGREDYSAYNDGIRLLGYNPTTGNYMGGIHIGVRYGWQLVRDGYTNTMKIRYRNVDTTNWGDWKTIAFTDSDITGKAGDSDKLEGKSLSWVQGNGRKFTRIAATSSNPVDANSDLAGGGMVYSYSNTIYLTNSPSGMGFGHIWQIGSAGGDALDGQLAWDNNHESTDDTTNKLWWRSRDSVNGWTYAKWHQIAFTDSTVDKAKKLVDAIGRDAVTIDTSGDVLFVRNVVLPNGANIYMRGLKEGEVLDAIYTSSNNGNLVIGNGHASAGYATYISGYELVFRYGKNRTQAMSINASGNVTIGAQDKAGNEAKLYVDGLGRFITNTSENNVEVGNTVNTVQLGVTSEGLAYLFGVKNYDMGFSTSATRRMTITAGGNVLIGKTTDNGKGKLQVEGDLHVTGNIIADGEVSAGGAGEEGSGSSSGGGGAFYSETFSAGISAKTITHGLGTEDIVVSIYEKNSTSGKWDMVLTDIEIEDANTIELTFGSATDVEHKVVIMGAVA